MSYEVIGMECVQSSFVCGVEHSVHGVRDNRSRLSAFLAMQQLPKLPKINIPDVKVPKDLFNQLLEGKHHGDAIHVVK